MEKSVISGLKQRLWFSFWVNKNNAELHHSISFSKGVSSDTVMCLRIGRTVIFHLQDARWIQSVKLSAERGGTNLTSDPEGGCTLALSLPINHHICDSLLYLQWMGCLKASSPNRCQRSRKTKEAPLKSLPVPPGFDGPPEWV